MFDCLDQQIFIMMRKNAIENLIDDKNLIQTYSGIATTIFMIGWATGGLIFGSVGDRLGRARTLTFTVLLYSVCTGLSALSVGWWDFAVYRFITGLGVGGVFGLAVALIADSLPERSRTGALGMLQALSAVGNITANLLGLLVAAMAEQQFLATASNKWKIMFLFGALPAFLCVFLQWRLKEPEAWVKAREQGRETGVKFGSYSNLFGDPILRNSAIFGTILCVAGVVGIWGIGFFAPDLVGDVIKNNLTKQGVAPEQIGAASLRWISYNAMLQNLGAFAGMLAFTYVAQIVGRRIAFAGSFILAMLATIGYYQLFSGVQDIWMAAVMGFFQMSLFAGFAIYLPELFPLRLRSTGTSFCYNVGRYIAATGPITLGYLQRYILHVASGGTGDPSPDQKIDALRDACTYMSAVFLIGLVALFFLPETKGKALPQ